MKGRMHKKMKSVDKAMMEKNLLVESLGLKGTDKMVKSMKNQNFWNLPFSKIRNFS